MVDFSRLVLRPGMRTFGRAVTYTAPGGSPVSQRGVFDNDHEIVRSAADGSEFSTTAPVLGVRLSEWSPEPVQGGTLEIDGVTFRVFDVQPDGQGGANVILRKVVA